jgi:hypothetical protein
MGTLINPSALGRKLRAIKSSVTQAFLPSWIRSIRLHVLMHHAYSPHHPKNPITGRNSSETTKRFESQQRPWGIFPKGTGAESEKSDLWGRDCVGSSTE